MLISQQAPQIEVASKRIIDGGPHVTTNMFLAEKQVERVLKKQKVETIEGKPHVTTYLILAEKQEVENAEKPHSKNKNKEIAKPEVEDAKVESSEGSNEAFDLDYSTTNWEFIEWAPCTGYEDDYPDEDEYWEGRGGLYKISADSDIDIDSDSDDDMSSEHE